MQSSVKLKPMVHIITTVPSLEGLYVDMQRKVYKSDNDDRLLDGEQCVPMQWKGTRLW
jgi:hypothetical protein